MHSLLWLLGSFLSSVSACIRAGLVCTFPLFSPTWSLEDQSFRSLFARIQISCILDDLCTEVYTMAMESFPTFFTVRTVTFGMSSCRVFRLMSCNMPPQHVSLFLLLHGLYSCLLRYSFVGISQTPSCVSSGHLIQKVEFESWPY